MKNAMQPVFLAQLTVALLLGVVACSADAAGLKPLAATGAATASGAMTASPKKPNGSGIQVLFKVTGTAERASVELQFDGVTDSHATVRLAADAGLTLDVGQEASPLPAGRSVSAITARASSAGLFYIHVTTVQNGRGSVVSIPVGSPAEAGKAAPVGELKSRTDGSGKLVVLPLP